jgi:hypothetical protein
MAARHVCTSSVEEGRAFSASDNLLRCDRRSNCSSKNVERLGQFGAVACGTERNAHGVGRDPPTASASPPGTKGSKPNNWGAVFGFSDVSQTEFRDKALALCTELRDTYDLID